MASITFFVGAFYLILYFSGRRQTVHLWFALMSIAVGMYDVFSTGLYDSTSVAQGFIWQQLQLQAVDFISVFLVGFVVVYTQRPRSRVLPVSAAWYALLLILSFVLSRELTFSPLYPEVKNVDIPGLLRVTYNEARIGLLYQIEIVSSLGLYAYMTVLLIRRYLATRVKGPLVVVCGMFAYFLGAINDTLVGLGVYSSVYVSEYAFMIPVLSMFFVLIRDLGSLYDAIERANATLEARVEERTVEIRRLNDDLRRLAELDPLTGIYNRRFFGEYLDIELRRARNLQEHRVAKLEGVNDMNFGLAMIDIDHFKRVNDTWGHPAGDKALVEVVRVIQSVIFSRDIFCRFGGEEFVILFTRTSRDGIVQAIEKIRKTVHDQVITVTDDGRTTKLTLSIGVVIFEEVPGVTTQQLLRVADNRLLSAKKAGRNVAVYE